MGREVSGSLDASGQGLGVGKRRFLTPRPQRLGVGQEQEDLAGVVVVGEEAFDGEPVRTAIPVLALNGSLDLQVLPALNLPPIRSGLAGNSQAMVQELEGLNHLFQHAQSGAPAEYGFID